MFMTPLPVSKMTISSLNSNNNATSMSTCSHLRGTRRARVPKQKFSKLNINAALLSFCRMKTVKANEKQKFKFIQSFVR